MLFTIKSIIVKDTYKKKRQEDEIQKTPKSPSNQHRSASVSFLSQKGAEVGRDLPGHGPRWTLQCPLRPPGGLRGRRDRSSPARKAESGNL